MFHLDVQRIEQLCIFELSWSNGLRLRAELGFPAKLLQLYHEWQQAYLSYYRSLQMPLAAAPEADPTLRGKVLSSGSGSHTLSIDWSKQLSDAELQLLYEFHRWLRSPELHELRAKIAAASRSDSHHQGVDVLLTCTPIALAKLPWETWEIGTDFAATGKIRIARVPVNIRSESAASSLPRRRSRPRILAILGDDTGLNFQVDRQAVRSLERLAEVRFIGWQPKQRIDDLKAQISQTIADERGWDVLFFAGHSNETELAGGELGIAPGVSMRINEIAPQLAIAKQRGLQFALFNSCSGLSLAESLIDLGLSQVAIMREPIHNRVAEEFLVRFMQELANHKDVHESLIAACQTLETEKKLTHPSAYLIPSLFRHPDAKLFRIPPQGWKQQLKAWLPRRYQAVALFVVVLGSFLPPVQLKLLDQRLAVQARLHPVPANATPPLLLVQIDEQSLVKANIRIRKPIPQDYLAELIQQLSDRGARIIGIDYLLDTRDEHTDKLAQVVQQAKQTQFVFVATQDNKGLWHWTLPEIANPGNSVHADAIRSCEDNYHMPLPQAKGELQPFAYQLAQLHQQGQTGQPLKLMHPDLSNPALPCTNLAAIAQLSYVLFRQLWLHPITDFSMPIRQLYQPIPAWTVLQPGAATPLPEDLSRYTVMIVPGGYEEAGIVAEDELFDAPAAVHYWYMQNSNYSYQKMTAGEHHAYLFHHFLTQRSLIPIPDLWMVLFAALVGRTIGGIIEQRSSKSSRNVGIILLISGTVLYLILSLGLFVFSSVLVPMVLPSALLWVYLLPPLLKKSS